MFEFPKKILVFLLTMNYSIGMEVSYKYKNNLTYSYHKSGLMKTVKTLTMLALSMSSPNVWAAESVNDNPEDLPHRLLASLDDDFLNNEDASLFHGRNLLASNIPSLIKTVCNDYFISNPIASMNNQVQYDKCVNTCKAGKTKAEIDLCLLKSNFLISTAGDNSIYKISAAPQTVMVYLNNGQANNLVKIPPIEFDQVNRPDPIDVNQPICFTANGDKPCDVKQMLLEANCKTKLSDLNSKNIANMDPNNLNPANLENIASTIPECANSQILEFGNNYNTINVYNGIPSSQKLDIHTTNTLTGTYYDYTVGIDSKNSMLNVDMDKTFSPVTFKFDNGTETIDVSLENNILKMPMAECDKDQDIFLDTDNLKAAVSVCKNNNGLEIKHKYNNFISVEKTNFSNINKRAIGFLDNKFRFFFQDKTLLAYLPKDTHDLFIKMDEFFSSPESPSTLKLCANTPQSLLLDTLDVLFQKIEINNSNNCVTLKFNYNLLTSVKEFFEYKAMTKEFIVFPINSTNLASYYPAGNFTLNFLNLLKNSSSNSILIPFNMTDESMSISPVPLHRLLQTSSDNKNTITTQDNPQVAPSTDVLNFGPLLIVAASLLVIYDLLNLVNKSCLLFKNKVHWFIDTSAAVSVWKQDIVKSFLNFEYRNRWIKTTHSLATWTSYYAIAMLGMQVGFVVHRNATIITDQDIKISILSLFAIKMVTPIMDLIRFVIFRSKSKPVEISVELLSHFINEMLNKHRYKIDDNNNMHSFYNTELSKALTDSLGHQHTKGWNNYFDIYQHNDIKQKLKYLNKHLNKHLSTKKHEEASILINFIWDLLTNKAYGLNNINLYGDTLKLKDNVPEDNQSLISNQAEKQQDDKEEPNTTNNHNHSDHHHNSTHLHNDPIKADLSNDHKHHHPIISQEEKKEDEETQKTSSSSTPHNHHQHKCHKLMDCFKSCKKKSQDINSSPSSDNVVAHELKLMDMNKLKANEKEDKSLEEIIGKKSDDEKKMLKASLIFMLFTLLSKHDNIDKAFLMNFLPHQHESNSIKLTEEMFNLYRQGILGGTYDMIVILNNFVTSAVELGLAVTTYMN